MPEMLEVETYRRLAESVVGRVVVGVDAPDPWYLKGGLGQDQIRAALVGGSISGTGRRGKLAWLELAERPTLGLRFGMTGRLLVDGRAGIDELAYGSAREEPAWDRFGLHFAGGGSLVLRDPRRLGGVELDPAVDRLGPDAWTVTVAELAVALGRSRAPLKARLMDQSRLAGLGNLLTDEILWRAGLSPLAAAGDVANRADATASLATAIRRTVAELDRRGGSHTGDLQPLRDRGGGPCPRDGTALRKNSVGGRTTWWCPKHQL